MTAPSRARTVALGLGTNVVELLLPQRWPLQMVDRIEKVHEEAQPVIEASRFLSASDVVFRGHFPGFHLWPGVLTIEGMGQAGAALSAIIAIRDRMAAPSGDRDAGYEALRNLERGFTLHPGFKPREADEFRAAMRGWDIGASVGAAVDVKLRRPVFAGQRLDYRVRAAHTVGDMVRYEVEASVNGAIVADGTMTGALLRQARATPEGA